MIDRQFFDNVLRKQLDDIRYNATVLVRTFSGEEYAVRRVVEVHDGFIVLALYPPEGQELPKRPGMVPDDAQLSKLEDERVWDRVVLPYSAIASVLLTARELRSPAGSRMGFFQESRVRR